jgi:signal transduction histidine kinase
MEQDQLIHAISSNARRLQRMLADLLDMDRLTRGVLEPEWTQTDLAALLEQLVVDSEIRHDHVVHMDVQPMVVDLDALKVGRIVDNLLVNARRHTSPGTEVWVAARAAEGGVLLIVEDAGPGVPEISRKRIFQPFTQLGEHAAKAPGVGIGLALVAKFAELHGGRAWVEERPGGGASFKVFLPSADRVAPGGTGTAGSVSMLG